MAVYEVETDEGVFEIETDDPKLPEVQGQLDKEEKKFDPVGVLNGIKGQFPKAVAESFVPPSVSLGRAAARFARENPEKALKAAVPVAATGIGLAGPAVGLGAAGTAAAVGLGSALTSVGQQGAEQALGINEPTTFAAKLRKAGTEGVKEGAFELIFPAAGIILKNVKAVGKSAGPILDGFGNFVRGTGKIAIENPEITKPGFFDALVEEGTVRVPRIQRFIVETGKSLDTYVQSVTDAWKKAASHIDSQNGFQGLIDSGPIVRKLKGLKEFIRGDVANKVDDSTVTMVDNLYNNLVERLAPQQDRAASIVGSLGETIKTTVKDNVPRKLNLMEAIELRQYFDRFIDFAKAGPGSGLDANVLKGARGLVDEMIGSSYPTFKAFDANYGRMIGDVNDMAKSLGIMKNTPFERYSISELTKAEQSIKNVIRKPGEEIRRLAQIDSRISKMGESFVREAEKLSASGQILGKKRVFEKFVRPGVTTFQGLGATTAAAVAGYFNPLFALPAAAFVVATSPRAIGAGIRASRTALGAAEASAPFLPGAARGVREAFSNDQ